MPPRAASPGISSPRRGSGRSGDAEPTASAAMRVRVRFCSAVRLCSALLRPASPLGRSPRWPSGLRRTRGRSRPGPQPAEGLSETSEQQAGSLRQASQAVWRLTLSSLLAPRRSAPQRRVSESPSSCPALISSKALVFTQAKGWNTRTRLALHEACEANLAPQKSTPEQHRPLLPRFLRGLDAREQRFIGPLPNPDVPISRMRHCTSIWCIVMPLGRSSVTPPKKPTETAPNDSSMGGMSL